MGSYDTGDYSPSSYTPPRRETPRREEEPPETSNYDASLPILIALGGGLTPRRIVKKLVPPEEYQGKHLIEIIKYIISPEVSATEDEISIAEMVRVRMEKPDYRAIINDLYNVPNERLREDTMNQYLISKERETESGPIPFNYLDLAIVSHDEGGRRKSLEEKL